MTWLYCPECGKPGLTCVCPGAVARTPDERLIWRPPLAPADPERAYKCERCFMPAPSTMLCDICAAVREARRVQDNMAIDENMIERPIKDSGERVTHTTGAVRDSAAGRGRYDLISPIMMERLAKHLEAGAQKYAERNWEKGLPIGRMFASLFRHSWQAFSGETDEDHLAAVICNAMFILHTLEMIKRGRLPESLDDLPDYRNRLAPNSLWHAFSEFRNHIALACTCLSGHTCANCKILKAADVALGR